MSANKLYQFQSTASGCLLYVNVGDKEVKFDFSNGHCAIVLSPEELAATKLNKSYGRVFALEGSLKNPASGHAVQVIVAKGSAPVAPTNTDEPDLSEAEEIEAGKAEIAQRQQFLAQEESEAKLKAAGEKKARKK